MKEKNYQLEVLRVISCMNVVLIHVCNLYTRSFGNISDGEYIFSVILNAFARTSVPIFFMISGATSLGSHYDFKKYLKKVGSIAGILVLSSILYRIWNIVYFDRAYDYHDLFSTPTKLHLWYLYAYLGVLIMLPFLQSMFRTLEKKYEILFVIIWFVSIISHRVLYRLNMSVTYPLPLMDGTYYVGYFVLGYLMNKYKTEIRIKRVYLQIIRWTSLCMTIGFVCYGSFSRDWYLQYRGLFIALQSTAMFLLILQKKSKKEVPFVKKMVTKIAKVSFMIYLIHPFFLDIYKTIMPYQNMSAYYMIFLLFGMTFASAYVTAWIWKFIKFKMARIWKKVKGNIDEV